MWEAIFQLSLWGLTTTATALATTGNAAAIAAVFYARGARRKIISPRPPE